MSTKRPAPPKRLKPTPRRELESRARAYLMQALDREPTRHELATWTRYLAKIDLETRRAIETGLRKG